MGGESNQWIELEKQTITYNAKGETTSIITQQNKNEKWENDAKEEFDWDSNGNKTIEASWIWDAANDKWNGKSKQTFSYTGNILTERTTYKWTTDQWLNGGRFLYTTDSNGMITVEESYYWSNDAWVGDSKKESSYTNGLLVKSTVSNWNKVQAVWIASTQNSQEYDTSGNKTKEIFARWNNILKEWGNVWEKEWIFDQENNKTLEAYHDWKNNDWVTKWKVRYIYTYKGDHPTALDKVERSGAHIFPNPVTEFVTISFEGNQATLSIYDLSGKKILNAEVEPKEKINIQNLPKGIYTYHIQSGTSRHTGKLVKQ